jgi:hypothetical protein
VKRITATQSRISTTLRNHSRAMTNPLNYAERYRSNGAFVRPESRSVKRTGSVWPMPNCPANVGRVSIRGRARIAVPKTVDNALVARPGTPNPCPNSAIRYGRNLEPRTSDLPFWWVFDHVSDVRFRPNCRIPERPGRSGPTYIRDPLDRAHKCCY